MKINSPRLLCPNNCTPETFRFTPDCALVPMKMDSGIYKVLASQPLPQVQTISCAYTVVTHGATSHKLSVVSEDASKDTLATLESATKHWAYAVIKPGNVTHVGVGPEFETPGGLCRAAYVDDQGKLTPGIKIQYLEPDSRPDAAHVQFEVQPGHWFRWKHVLYRRAVGSSEPLGAYMLQAKTLRGMDQVWVPVGRVCEAPFVSVVDGTKLQAIEFDSHAISAVPALLTFFAGKQANLVGYVMGTYCGAYMVRTRDLTRDLTKTLLRGSADSEEPAPPYESAESSCQPLDDAFDPFKAPDYEPASAPHSRAVAALVRRFDARALAKYHVDDRVLDMLSHEANDYVTWLRISCNLP